MALVPIRHAMALLVTVVAVVGCGGTETGGGGAPEGPKEKSETSDQEPSGGWEALLASEEQCPAQRHWDAPDQELRDAAICLIDHARAQRDLPTLDRSSTLHEGAAGKVDDIVKCNEFSHSACGRDPMHWFDEVGYGESCRRVGTAENLGFGERNRGSPRHIVLGWLESPKHRRNMLSDRWNEQAIARRRLENWSATLDGDEKRSLRHASVWVSHFGYRSSC